MQPKKLYCNTNRSTIDDRLEFSLLSPPKPIFFYKYPFVFFGQKPVWPSQFLGLDLCVYVCVLCFDTTIPNLNRYGQGIFLRNPTPWSKP